MPDPQNLGLILRGRGSGYVRLCTSIPVIYNLMLAKGCQKSIILAVKVKRTNFLYLSQKFEEGLPRFLKPVLRICSHLCQPKCQSLT